MRKLFLLGLALVLVSATTATADKPSSDDALASGPKVGARLGAFNVTKCAGAEEDGVEEGRELCYRCRNGSRPQVMVFTRSTDGKVVELVKKLDKAAKENDEASLRVFVNVLDEDREAASDKAKKFAAATSATEVPFVVPNEFENGPDNYGINEDAAVTIVLASDSKVKATYATANAEQLNIDAVIKDLGKILN